MTTLRVLPLGVHDAPEKLPAQAAARMDKMMEPGHYTFVDHDPDVFLFLTGGTERLAIEMVRPGKFHVLIGSQHNNAYASATEVKAWLNEKNISSLLLDEEEAVTKTVLNDLLKVKEALARLRGKRLGLIGQVSDWLVASVMSADLLKQKLGIELLEIPWGGLSHFSEFDTSGSLLKAFSEKTEKDLIPTSRVHELLQHVVRDQELDAITVECFPMVQKDCVTACLPLAHFNDNGIPAGCEGDLTAITGMMLCKELTGAIPWIANINKATKEACMFSHCTIALSLVSDFSINTHFETGLGTAIQGEYNFDRVTIFRFDRHLSKAFIAVADITERPLFPSACRTQIEVRLTEKQVKLLRDHPLGNHHLIVPGDRKRLLQQAFSYLGMEML